MTGDFDERAKLVRESLGFNVSPCGQYWKAYIAQHLEMSAEKMKAYVTRSYARLTFDKYIESNRRMDNLAKSITKNRPSAVCLGDASMAANSFIGTKKGQRCPSNKKLENSIKKLGHSFVIRVNEDYTSQTCANCMRKFPKNTKSHRFKACIGCQHPTQKAPLIVTKKNRRRLHDERRELERPKALAKWKEIMETHEMPSNLDHMMLEFLEKPFVREQTTDQGRLGRQCIPYIWQEVKRLNELAELKEWLQEQESISDEVAEQLRVLEIPIESEQPTNEGRLGLRKSYFRKNWYLNPEDVEIDAAEPQPRPYTIVWHRDIVAALCILYKGKHQWK